MISPTVSLWILLALIGMHWSSDFLLQTDKMATTKSSSNKWLTIHVATYITPFLVVFGWKYALVNFVLHWCTDYCSSRVTKKLWADKKVHEFFVVIGLDQAIHMNCLVLTIPLMGW